ncbi:O-Antigen ligase [Cryobacterium psychrotolerans]|uniref:O-Antigen ligase n=2 Tax=Microbacteriaceae TaxID=85023 RepID=A0A1G9BWK4_9MICO|nr:O-Antigen ligase [Cryobacterium psychrotolerans]
MKVDATNLFAIAFTLWCVISQTWALNTEATGLAIQNHLAVLAIFLAIRTSIFTRRGLLLIAWGYLAGCLVATYQLFRQNPSASVSSEFSNARLGIEGLNINYVAYALAVGLAVIILLWADLRDKRVRALLAVSAVPICMAIWFSGTRGAFLAAALLVVWLVIYRMRPPLTLGLAWVAVGITGGAIATGLADAVLKVVDADSARSTGDLAGRLTVWPAAREVLGDNILTGVGAGGFRTVSDLGIGAHNVILEIGTGTGLVGIVLFLGVYISALTSATAGAPIRLRSLLVGSILLVSAPMYLSGHWELSAAGWIVLALYSRISVLQGQPYSAEPERPGEERRAAARSRF